MKNKMTWRYYLMIWFLALGATVLFLAIVAGASWGVHKYVFEMSVLAQNGMYPNVPLGDKVFIWKRAYHSVNDVQRGDIVAFYRQEKEKHYLYIWRVVALPKETIKTIGQHISLNGTPVRSTMVREEPDGFLIEENLGAHLVQVFIERNPRESTPDVTVTVPEDHLFVMGDNRSNAQDSRVLGPIDFKDVVGKAIPLRNKWN